MSRPSTVATPVFQAVDNWLGDLSGDISIPDQQPMSSLPGKLPSGEESEAKYRRITQHLRTLITSGQLKPNARLPAIKVLAKQWNTNYFTVHLALNPLANEGLIERNRGSGTFVRNPKNRLSSAGIYYGANLWTDQEGAFYQRLCHELQIQLDEQKIRPRIFIDTRPPSERFSPLPELAKAIEQREVQGVIGVMLNVQESQWLNQLTVPISRYSNHEGVHENHEAMFDLALQRLAREGCKTVGAITGGTDYALWEKLASAHGMTTRLGWFKDKHANDLSFHLRGEEFGYSAFKEIWAHQSRPEGLIVRPDWICRGVIIAMLELEVHVPEHLRLVLYRNEGIDYLCPWKVPYLVLDIKKAAEALIDMLNVRHRTGKLNYVSPPFTLDLVG